jgi:flagellar motor switch protein FliM
MSQILSQDEVDALLKGLSDGDIETEEETAAEQRDVQEYDLSSPRKIVRGKLPSLDITNENFTRMFRKTLSTTLRRVVGINTLSVNYLKYEEFLRTLPLPSSLHIFKMPPLKGEMLLIVESKLIFTLVDCLFGGTGKEEFKVEGRDFTPIENNLIKKIVLSALSDLEEAWKSMVKVNTVYMRSEMNPQFGQIVAPSDVVVVIRFEIEMDYSSGLITLCVPYASLEPIRDKLQGSYSADKLEADEEWIARVREEIKKSAVGLCVELGQTGLTGREIANLKKGDVVLLDQYISDPLPVYLGQNLKFKGRPGVCRGNRAIQITEIIMDEGAYDEQQ